MTSKLEAYLQGYVAELRGVPVTDNPYAATEHLSKEWHNGWQAAKIKELNAMDDAIMEEWLDITRSTK